MARKLVQLNNNHVHVCSAVVVYTLSTVAVEWLSVAHSFTHIFSLLIALSLAFSYLYFENIYLG